MKYLVLWSGNIRGARKVQIDSEPAHLIGHLHNGELVTFNGVQFRDALPERHRRAWDEHRVFTWLDKHEPDAPFTVELYDTKRRLMARYYVQPLTKG